MIPQSKNAPNESGLEIITRLPPRIRLMANNILPRINRPPMMNFIKLPIIASYVRTALQACYNIIMTAGGFEPPRQFPANSFQSYRACQLHHAVISESQGEGGLLANPSPESPIICRALKYMVLYFQCMSIAFVFNINNSIKYICGGTPCRYALSA